MNTVDFVETIQVLTPEEVKIVNAELDKKEFIVSSIGFEDGKTGEPRVDYLQKSIERYTCKYK